MDTNTAAAVGIVGLIMSFFFIAVIWYVLCLISRWKVFDKAGIAGWKSLIPIYSDYCTFKIADTRKQAKQFRCCCPCYPQYADLQSWLST